MYLRANLHAALAHGLCKPVAEVLPETPHPLGDLLSRVHRTVLRGEDREQGRQSFNSADTRQTWSILSERKPFL